ncbi:MAG: hypothetical protein ACRYFX_10050 [Janthinobacterium lividum]
MSTVQNENQPGRPAIKINLSEAVKLCHLGCTLREVAGFFECSEDTVQRVIKEERGQTFSEFYDMHSAGGDISLRKAQFQKAISGDVKMLIFLGKQRLGQTEKQEVDHRGAVPVTWSETRTYEPGKDGAA